MWRNHRGQLHRMTQLYPAVHQQTKTRVTFLLFSFCVEKFKRTAFQNRVSTRAVSHFSVPTYNEVYVPRNVSVWE